MATCRDPRKYVLGDLEVTPRALTSVPAGSDGQLVPITDQTGKNLYVRKGGNLVPVIDTSACATILFDTRANIIAASPVAKTIALSNDTFEFFSGDGTNWQALSLPMGIASIGPDRGALPFKEDWGYGQSDIASKNLHNIVMKDFTEGVTQLEKGAFKYDYASNTLMLYSGTSWLTIITLTQAQVDDWMLQSNWNASSVIPANSIDTANKTVMTLGFVDMGAIPSDVILDGGVLI